MESTRSKLKKLMKAKKMTINEFALKAGINKGTLSSAVNGNRKINEPGIMKIIKSDLLDETEREELCDCYFCEEYGSDSLKKVKHYFSCLNDERLREEGELTAIIPDCSDFITESGFAELTSDILIQKAVTVLMRDAIINGNIVYTNFSCEHNDIDDIVYSLIAKSDSEIKLKHLVTFSLENSSLNNVSIAFSLIKYMQKKVNAYYKTVKFDNMLENEDLYSYYFSTEDSLVLYDKNLTSGIFVQKRVFTQLVFKKLQTQFKEYALLCHFPENVLSEMDDLSTVTDEEHALRLTPHVLSLLDKDDWNACISDNMENKSALAELAFSWYASERGKATVNFSTSDGWWDFLKTGRIYTQPAYLVNNFDIKLRRKLVQKVIDNMKTGVTTHFILDSVLKLPKNLIVEQIGNYIFFVTSVTDPEIKQWLGSAFFCFPIKNISGDFDLIEKYMKLSGYIFSEEKAVRVLDNLMAHCQNELTIENIIK